MIRMHVRAVLLMCGLAASPLLAQPLDGAGEHVSIHGFISQGFLLSDANDVYTKSREGSFQFNELGLAFSVLLSNRLHVGMQALSRDLGEQSNNAVELDWAFADYRWKDWLGFRGGLLKMPWGIYNETRDIDMLRTSIFLPSSLYPEQLRDAYDTLEGIAFYGSSPVWEFGTINYQLLYGDKSLPTDYVVIDHPAEAHITVDAFDVQDMYMGALEWETPLQGLRFRQTTGKYLFSIRGTHAPVTGHEIGRFWEETGDQVFSILSADYSTARFSIALETQQIWDDRNELNVEGNDAVEGGWYISASYRLNEWWELGAYYSEFYEDTDDPEGREYIQEGLPAYLAWQKDLALTTRFDIGDHITLKFEGHLIDGVARLFWDRPSAPERDTRLLAAKATFNF